MSESGVPGQVPINWGRVLLTLVVGGVPTAICFIFGLWWWGTLLLLLTLLAACFGFPREIYPMVFTVFAIFAIALLTGAWLDVALHKEDASAWWRDALPVLGGFGIGVVVPAFFWFVTFAVSTKWVLGLPDVHEVDWWKAFTFVSIRAFRLAWPIVHVENGKMRETLDTGGLLEGSIDPKYIKAFGGPGVLVVGEGNVVVLERGGKLSRVLGEGSYALRRGEWFKRPVESKGIHDLRGGGGPPMPVENVVTRDGVLLNIKFMGKCHLERKQETDDRPASRYAESSSPVIGENSQYPIYRATILKAVYKTGDKGWKTLFPSGAQVALRNAIADYTLDQIMGMPGAGQQPVLGDRAGEPPAPGREVIREIEGRVKEAVGQRPLAQGVVLDWVAIADIDIPKKARKAMEDRWAEPIRSRLLLRDAEIERDKKIAESQGKAASILAVEQARNEASDAWVSLLERLRDLLPRVQDPDVARQFARIVQELLLRVGEDDLEGAMRQSRRAQGWPDQRFGMQMGLGGAPGSFGLGPGQSPQPPLLDGAGPTPDTQQGEPKS